MIRDTPRGNRLKTPLVVTLERMSDNAGVKRNRRAHGTTVERKIHFSHAAESAIDNARMASGKLSTSLYLELLVAQLQAEHGSLPVLSPTLDGIEEVTTTAA